ncbi:gp42-like protein [Bufonid herpesvirus 1]|uniref:gp42-like protein n=1 Tax=Bufonid herpesvirus 1 TaxID=2282206 RepID=UPI000EB6722E|nr:gp42-like protein [Bufonid herpesvirus 1]AXF48517.1 gp42-like protein [Bufonid herpesvirus 1]
MEFKRVHADEEYECCVITNDPGADDTEPMVEATHSRRQKNLTKRINCCIFTVLVFMVIGLGIMCYILIQNTPEPEKCSYGYAYSDPCGEGWVWWDGDCYFISKTQTHVNNVTNYCSTLNALPTIFEKDNHGQFINLFLGHDSLVLEGIERLSGGQYNVLDVSFQLQAQRHNRSLTNFYNPVCVKPAFTHN